MGRYCVIGEHLPHTKSKEIHELFGCELYEVVELEKEDVGKLLTSKYYDGMNVTIPYKQLVIPYLDYIDDIAKGIGAINTIVLRDGLLYGYNTDVGGMQYAMKKGGIELTDKEVLILGTGGTSKTAEYVAKLANAKSINICGRNGKINYSNVVDVCKDTQIIINTTPVGMFPNANAMPLNPTKFSKLEGVFDAIYNPIETKFVKTAKKNGINGTNGLRMLVEQARLAEELFFNKEINQEETERIYKIIAKTF